MGLIRWGMLTTRVESREWRRLSAAGRRPAMAEVSRSEPKLKDSLEWPAARLFEQQGEQSVPLPESKEPLTRSKPAEKVRKLHWLDWQERPTNPVLPRPRPCSRRRGRRCVGHETGECVARSR